jgi:hypothetical protein
LYETKRPEYCSDIIGNVKPSPVVRTIPNNRKASFPPGSPRIAAFHVAVHAEKQKN